MKISIINGSPRPNGATGKILKAFQNYLADKEDVVINYYDLSEYRIISCKGCIDCYRTGICIITDDQIENISRQIKESDAIIIGSPTYGSAITGNLKSFMDRGHFIVEQSLTHQYGFAVATYEIANGKKTMNMIKQFLLVSGAARKGSLLVKLAHNTQLNNSRLSKTIAKKAEKFYQAVQKKAKKSWFENVFMNIIVIPFVWKPYFLKNKERYRGVLELWQAKNII